MTEPPARPVPYVPPPPYVRPLDGGAPWPGPPGYQGYYPPQAAAPGPAAPPLAFGTVGASLAGLGTFLLLLAQLALPWYDVDGGLRASAVRARLAGIGTLANDLSTAYFSWLGWVLLLLALGCALLAALPRPAVSIAFRIAGPIVAGFAALFTVGAAQLVDTAYGDDTYYLVHLASGFWMALLGFACIGAGAIVGPRRARPAARRFDRPGRGATFGK